MSSRTFYGRGLPALAMGLLALLAFFSTSVLATSSYDGWGLQQVLGPEPPNSQFGDAVAVDGDTAVVAAPFWTYGEHFSHGRLAVYTFSNGVWELDTVLLTEDNHPGLRLGASVAIDGDVILAGAPGAIVNGINQHGAAYLFRRVDGQWQQEAKLVADEPTNGSSFGLRVAVSGDRALVSAETRNVAGQNNAGVAYAFRRGDNGWEQEARLEPAVAVGSGRFSAALALSGDYAVIAAPLAALEGLANAGAVYVFEHDGTDWSQTQRVAAATPAAHQQFGHAVGLDGERFAVGAPRTVVDNVAFTGAAYIFEQQDNGWEETAMLVAGDSGSNEQYADAVSLDGDRLLVGASRASSGGIAQAGAAYLYELDDSWQQVARLGPTDPAMSEYANFAKTVGLSGDRIAIGQPGLDVHGDYAPVGAAYFFVPLPDIAFVVTPQVVAGLGTTAPETPQLVPYGQAVSFDLLPDPGYHVLDVDSDCGDTTLEGLSLQIDAVQANCTVSVSFAINPPTQALAFAGSGQATGVNATFADALVVRVINDADLPVPGIEVTVEGPAAGAGALHAASGTTNAEGELVIPVTANSVAGTYTITANTPTVDEPAVFTLTNTPDAPAQLRALQGDGQQASTGQVFPLPLSVQVLDAWNNVIPGLAVDFQSAGSGPAASLSPATTSTDAQGIARTVATANDSAGTHIVTASANGLQTVEFALENREPDVQLAISLVLQQTYVAYGHLLNVLVTVHNTGQDAVSGVEVVVPAPGQVDAANMQWLCLMHSLGHCAASGSGPLHDTGAHLPAGSSLAYLVSAPIRLDAQGHLVAVTAAADAGPLGAALAEGQATLVVFRHGFEQPEAWQPVSLAPDATAGAGLGVNLRVPVRETVSSALQSLYQASSGEQWLRVEHLDGQWVRLVAGSRDRGEYASRWLAATPGTWLELAASTQDDEDTVVLNGHQGSVALTIPANGLEWTASGLPLSQDQ